MVVNEAVEFSDELSFRHSKPDEKNQDILSSNQGKDGEGELSFRQSSSALSSKRNQDVQYLQDPDQSLTGVLYNPVKSGYLWCMSGREHNSENIKYLIQIDSFKDAVRDNSAWNPDIDYKFIDSSIPEFDKILVQETDFINLGDEAKWSSKIITFKDFSSKVMDIWNNHLSKNSTEQICMSAKVLQNTLRRLQFLHLYGPSVFDETLIDPKKTLATDMMPRFIVSPCHKRMRIRLGSLFPLPLASELKLPSPQNCTVIDRDDDNLTIASLKNLTLENVFEDQLLYNQFLEFTKKNVVEEYVLFVRAVNLFKITFLPENRCKDPNWLWSDVFSPEAEDMGWLIFKYFICPGSSYDIGVSLPRRKDIMHLLARPEETMFDKIYSLAMKAMENKWTEYKASKEFENLPTVIRDYKYTFKTIKQSSVVQTQNYGWFSSFKFLVPRYTKYNISPTGSSKVVVIDSKA